MAQKLAIEPNPDFSRLEKVLRRQAEPDRVPFYELFSNIEDDVLLALGRLDTAEDDSRLSLAEQQEKALKKHIDYMFALGYDFVNVWCRDEMEFQADSVEGMTQQGVRNYQQANTHVIDSREDFDSYPWPDMAAGDYSPLQRVAEFLPEGMKVITGYPGVLETVMYLLGYEGISYKLFEDEPLVRDVFDTVGRRVVEHLRICASYDTVGAVSLGDDMGFKTQTLFSPATYRQYLFGWHKKAVQVIHDHGKPAILHSCGNKEHIMEDIIDCGWDALHSFEDVIEPVWRMKQKWGDRIALLGGFDMDKICRMSPEQVRGHTRLLIEKCGPGGGWALGTGNSVANYVPPENFLAMLEEGYKAGFY